MWVFTYKLSKDGSMARYMAQLDVRGFPQRPAAGVEYHGKHSTLRASLALSADRRFELHTADVTKAYLNAEEDEEILLQQPRICRYSGHRGYANEPPCVLHRVPGVSSRAMPLRCVALRCAQLIKSSCPGDVWIAVAQRSLI
jgi:hypothetical protein